MEKNGRSQYVTISLAGRKTDVQSSFLTLAHDPEMDLRLNNLAHVAVIGGPGGWRTTWTPAAPTETSLIRLALIEGV
jgi:hypothetical protein